MAIATKAIKLADDIEMDVQAENSIVRYLLSRAKYSATEAMAEMALSDPNDVARMKQLQSAFNHYGDIRLWLSEAIQNGNEQFAVAQQLSTAEAREALDASREQLDQPEYGDD